MKKKIDPVTTIIPLFIILALCFWFVLAPEQSTNVLSRIRSFLGDQMGLYYLIVGLLIFGISLYFSFSKIGNIRLGSKDEKPKYNFWSWGAMLFTAGLAADILFYSMCEWMMYADEPHVSELGSIQDWASTMPLFHWGPIVWSFYAVLAACFGYMLHVRGCNKQRYSEACRPILGKHTDGLPGKIIDTLAVMALIAGCATTFSVSSPLLSMTITRLFGIPSSTGLTIVILLAVCGIYTTSVLRGMAGINFLSKTCMYVFGLLLLYVLIFGGQAVYILETGFSALGNMIQNFIGLSTWTDPLRTSSFPQNWTIFYWAYWLVWCVASPFFMGSISRGRTVKQIILGAYVFGMGATLVSFIILGNYGLGIYTKGTLDVMSVYHESGDLYYTIMAILETLPAYKFVLVILAFSMIAFYATSFDSITMVASAYSYRKLDDEKAASTPMKLFWAILLILLPIALIFNESSMNNLQTISIIAAFPVGIVILLIIASFIKDVKDTYKESEKE